MVMKDGGRSGDVSKPKSAENPSVAAPTSIGNASVPISDPAYLIKGRDGVYFMFDPATDDLVGTLVDQRDGWWRCRAPDGRVREVFVEPDVDEPWRDVAERITRT